MEFVAVELVALVACDWWYMQDSQTPVAWQRDQQYNMASSRRTLGSTGSAPKCSVYMLKKALLSTLKVLPVLVVLHLACQWGSNWQQHKL